MIRQHPAPTPEQLRRFYDDSYRNGMYLDFAAASELKLATARRRVKEISRMVPLQGRWLDVGCSTGSFVKAASSMGIASEGIDVSKEAVDVAQTDGLPVKCGDVFSLDPCDEYDCVTAFDVIEHVPDPALFLRAVHRLLKLGGKLVLTTPNLNSLGRFLMGRRWFFYIPDEHLNLFSPPSLRKLVAKNGFSTMHTGRTYKPMTFDYASTQFKEFNPLVGKWMTAMARCLPSTVRSFVVSLPIGEQLLIAERE